MARRTKKQIMLAAKYPTGLQVNLTGQEGNVFHILGTCRYIANELNLTEEQRAEFNLAVRLDNNKSYEQILDICQQWFGLVYIGRK